MNTEDFNIGTYEEVENWSVAQYRPDIRLLDHYNKEYSMRFLPRVAYYKLDLSNTVVDSFYGEAEEIKYYNKLYIPINYVKDPQVKILNQFGIQHNRALQVNISTSILKRFNLNPKIGDILEIEGDGYTVNEMNKLNYAMGTDTPLTMVLFCTKTNMGDLPLELQQKYTESPL